MYPSDYLNNYRNRIQNSGNLLSSSKAVIDSQFSSHPNFKVVLIDGLSKEVIYTQGKKSEDKELLLRSGTSCDIGSVVQVNGNSYLVMDFIGEGINEIYPTAKLNLCNSTFPIQSNKTQVLVGEDSEGRPVYEDTYETTSLPCIVADKLYVKNADEQLPLPEGKLLIIVQFIDFNMVKENYEFTMYNSAYKVTSIDYTKVVNNKGYITIHADKVVS